MLDRLQFADECHRRAAEYVAAVLAGDEPCGKLERLTVARHDEDLHQSDENEDFPYYFDENEPDRVFQFFSLLHHTKGRQWSGKQFVLAGWQALIILVLFGWRRKSDGFRRFRMAYIQLARKNGKTTFLAGILLYLLIHDSEQEAEIVAAATKRDQAKIVFHQACRMVKANSRLKRLVEISGGTKDPKHMYYDRLRSTFDPLGKDADTLDGLNPHGVGIDELHAHKTRALWDVLDTGTGGRLQPLLIAITTAGSNHESICYEQRDYAIKLLEQTLDDNEYFAFIAELDDGDDWTNPANFRKANPNLGVTVRREELEQKLKQARVSSSAQNNFRVKRLNQWVSQSTRWLDMEQWAKLPRRNPDLTGRRCYAGLDLSATRDLTALVLVFPPAEADRFWSLMPFFFCPEETVKLAYRERRIPYDGWSRDGWLTATPGNIVDYSFVRAQLNELQGVYEIAEVGYDPWNSSQIVIELQDDGFELVKMRQGYATLHAPTKELEKLVIAGAIDPGDNPVMRWMASNVTVVRDPAGNMKPTKENANLKIDGIVAAIMGIGRAMAAGSDVDRNAHALVLRA